MHNELRLSVVRDGKKYNLYDFFVIPGNRARRFVVDGYIWPGLHTPAVTGDFPSMKAAQDWFENETGIRPPRWKKSLKLGQNSIEKREAMMKHRPVTAKKNPRRKFGRKRTLKSAVKKIRAHVPQRYVITARVDGVKYFFNGRGFDSVGSHAAAYVNRKHAASVSRSIRGFLPHKIKSLSVEPL